VHDVLDPRDQVPDEAEQLLHSGYEVSGLLAAARSAAAGADLEELERISLALDAVRLAAAAPFDEPSDSASLEEFIERLPAPSPAPPDLGDRLYGAWLGRCVGNTLGKPVEGLRREEVEIYLRAVGQWPQTTYLPMLEQLPDGVSHLHESAPFAAAGRFDDVPRDDDIDWTILGLAMLEEHGQALTTADIARAWLDRLPFTQTFTAERVAYRNLVRGIGVEDAAQVANPYREWIGALIRTDVYGYVHPGDPVAAARLALVDARLSHTANGIYGAIWAAALVSAAFTAGSVREALGVALTGLPPTSRLAAAQTELLALFDSGADAAAALAWIDRTLGHYNWVHTINNAAIISFALLWGTDFTGSVALAISAGRDTDSTGATVGSVYGAMHGSAAVPDALVGTTHTHVRSAVLGFDRIRITSLAGRTERLAARFAAEGSRAQ
jgi:ADP-ribosylglycohydrolase